MTGIIFRGIEQQNFSILKFYVSRANRIIPALAVLCFIMLVFGFFYLNPIDYGGLAKHVASSMVFLSNITYWRESGYFDAVSSEKWLLHTWSLSVEWQFYLIYPLVLVAMRKVMPIKAMRATVLVGTILGFIFCVIVTYKWPNPAYYLLPTRMWELMIGGVAYLYPFNVNNTKKQLLEWIGLALIVSSYLFISKENAWPGYLALIPVLGAFLVIQAQRNDSVITGNIVFQKLGAWSYSIYLWHWPIVVATYFYSLNEVTIYFGILLSVFLGYISNKYVEKMRFRTDFNQIYSYLKCKPVYMVLILSTTGILFSVSNGLNFRLAGSLQIKNEKALEAIGDSEYPEPNLIIENHRVRYIEGRFDKNILFIGASHIKHVYPYVELFDSEYNLYFVTEDGCFISPSFVNPKWSCANIQDYQTIINAVKFEKIVTSTFVLDSYLSDDEGVKREQIKIRVSEYNDFLRFAKSKSEAVYMILGEPRGDEFSPKLSLRHDLKNFVAVKDVRESYN